MIADERKSDLGRGLLLEYITIGWNVLEAAVGLIAGIAAGSVALVGFALDSVVEASSGGVLVWRLRSEAGGRRSAEDVERRAVRGVALAFFSLAAYVSIRAVIDLLGATAPGESIPGIVLALVSLVAMPLLAWQKRKTAQRLDSRALQGDARQSMICTYLSFFLLIGLAANALWGLWWADPVAALAIAGIAANEGRELWITKEFCCV